MYIVCVILRLFSALSCRVGALQISIIIIIIIGEYIFLDLFYFVKLHQQFFTHSPDTYLLPSPLFLFFLFALFAEISRLREQQQYPSVLHRRAQKKAGPVEARATRRGRGV